MRKLVIVFSLVLLGPFYGAVSQTLTPIEPDSAKPTEQGYEIKYQERLQNLMNARSLTPTNGNAGVDEGKSTWNRLLANIYKNRLNPTWVQNEIDTRGLGLLRSQWAGSFCGPFSTVGYAAYYFQCKTLLSQAQKDSVRNNLYNIISFPNRCSAASGWDLLMRPDGFMDPTVSDNQTPNFNLTGTEFNSENYHWMLRGTAYLFAQEFQEAQYLQPLTDWYKNLTRAVFNVGRIEWNSNNYWGHTFNPLLNLYNFAWNADDKRRAKALCDWNVLELALHHLDGEHVAGADPRAKSNAYRRFAGSATPFVFQYFADTTIPAYTPSYGNLANYGNTSARPDWDSYQGFLCYSTYRPSQQIIDIARRKFAMPVEIHSAKPFYRADYNFYADWQGNGTNSERNEFEFLYLNHRYILNSVATKRPDGGLGTFSEQSIWRLGVAGTQSGNIQIMGNSGATNTMAGRWPYEQVGQFRNILLRTVKNTDSLWIGVPQSLSPDWVGDTLFLDFNNGVYAAFIPYGTTSRTESAQAGDAAYRRITFNANTSLAALALEVGTSEEFTDFNTFKSRIATAPKFSLDSIDKISYRSASGHSLTMAYQPPISYTLLAPRSNLTALNPAGTLPKLWQDGIPVNFNNWQVYEVVHGQDIIRQNRGSGELTLASQGNGLKMKVDPATAEVTYSTFQEAPVFVNSSKGISQTNKGLVVYPNPITKGSLVKIQLLAGEEMGDLSITDASGKQISNQMVVEKLQGEASLDTRNLKPGLYIIEVNTSKNHKLRGKLLVTNYE